jgi:hypothetical protein
MQKASGKHSAERIATEYRRDRDRGNRGDDKGGGYEAGGDGGTEEEGGKE